MMHYSDSPKDPSSRKILGFFSGIVLDFGSRSEEAQEQDGR